VLSAIEDAQHQFPNPRLRHRIEHCSIVTPEILTTMRRLGVIAVPFGSYVAYHGEKLLAWYGRERLNRMFAHRAFLDAGIPVAGSSDYPCGPYQPLLGMQSCVTRESADGEVLGGEQRITAREALRLYTLGSAFAAGEQHAKGCLAPGFLADFTVLDEDLLRVSPSRIASVAVRSSWRAGHCVWQA
jgi:predicted amidohydrolase YtcJ